MRPTTPITPITPIATISTAIVTAAIAGLSPSVSWAQETPAAATPAPTSLPSVEPPAELERPGDMQEALRAHHLRRERLEVELRRIRHTYFRNPRAKDLRAAGIEKLRAYNDPAIFESMIEMFARSGDDVIEAIMGHLAELDTPEALATIAWTAVFDTHPRRRSMAKGVLAQSLKNREAPRTVKSVVADGLRRSHDPHVANAAGLAATLKMADAIPAMIASQVVGRGTGSDGGALAYILVGQQQAFVSDLEPVVGDSAVAFDPELSVVTDGVVLRVLDSVVVTYRVEVHQALVCLTSDLSGTDTSYLGWDVPKWRRWYTKEFLPEHGPK